MKDHPSQGVTARSTDPDLLEQARPGCGVPSQDPDPAAQVGLDDAETAREVRSALTGGGMIAGAVLGCALGALMAGGVGVVLGGVLGGVAGSVLGALSAMAAGVRVQQEGDHVFLHY